MLAFFAGTFGVHRFYLGQIGIGLMYLFAFIFLHWKWIIPIVAMLDAFLFIIMSEREFHEKYNKKSPWRNDVQRDEDRAEEKRREREAADQRAQRSRDEERARRARDEASQNKTQVKRVDVEAFKASGVKKFKDYDFKGALIDFTKVIEDQPNDVPSLFNLACTHAMLEETEQAYFQLSRAVELGYNDFERIKTHDSLAYMRIQPDWPDFVAAGYRIAANQSATLLQQIKQLTTLREQGRITEEEFADRSRQLFK